MSYYKTHVSLEINSRKRSKGTIEDFVTRLSHQIKFSQKDNKSYYMRLENILIPNSYYDVNATNNVFRVIETAGTFNVTIAPGNYTISELLTELETGLDTGSAASGDTNTYTLVYDDITNKVDITFVAGGTSTIDTIANGSTLSFLLGFSKQDTATITGGDTTNVLVAGVATTAPNCVDLHTISYILVESSLTSQNYYDEDGQIHIGVRVPMMADRNEIQFFANHNGHLTRINNKGPLSEIGFTLKDEFDNILDLCEVDWSCEVNFYELTKVENSSHP